MTLKSFDALSEKEILALAISAEEEDSRIYGTIAGRLRDDFPASAQVFDTMAREEKAHRDRLYALFQTKFGDDFPLVRRSDVKGFVRHRAIWLAPSLHMPDLRRYVAAVEQENQRFYRKAAEASRDLSVRRLLNDLADAEAQHEGTAERVGARLLDEDARAKEEETARRLFVLQYVQPGLAGLMDGSVSTLAPVFAAAFATHSTWDTFLVGMAASLGAGISMGFAEALSDDGSLTGRGAPLLRGATCGVMTTLGGVGHTLPYLIPDFWAATALAIAVVVLELGVISWIRWRYMDTPFLSAAFQVMVGGALVFVTGILIGSS